MIENSLHHPDSETLHPVQQSQTNPISPGEFDRHRGASSPPTWHFVNYFCVTAMALKEKFDQGAQR
jgi:hypothetical protein